MCHRGLWLWGWGTDSELSLVEFSAKVPAGGGTDAGVKTMHPSFQETWTQSFGANISLYHEHFRTFPVFRR